MNPTTYQADSNEIPQCMFLWRTVENYPLIIFKYQSYLFHSMIKCLPTETMALNQSSLLSDISTTDSTSPLVAPLCTTAGAPLPSCCPALSSSSSSSIVSTSLSSSSLSSPLDWFADSFSFFFWSLFPCWPFLYAILNEN